MTKQRDQSSDSHQAEHDELDTMLSDYAKHHDEAITLASERVRSRLMNIAQTNSPMSVENKPQALIAKRDWWSKLGFHWFWPAGITAALALILIPVAFDRPSPLISPDGHTDHTAAISPGLEASPTGHIVGDGESFNAESLDDWLFDQELDYIAGL